MKLSKKQILEFRHLYKKYFDIELSLSDASRMATHLVGIITATSICREPTLLTNENDYEQRTSTKSLSKL